MITPSSGSWSFKPEKTPFVAVSGSEKPEKLAYRPKNLVLVNFLVMFFWTTETSIQARACMATFYHNGLH
jgi:hypothetical protein